MVGRAFGVVDVLVQSAKILFNRPVLVLPALIPATILTLLFPSIPDDVFFAQSSFLPTFFLGLLATIVAYVLVDGAYPILVRSILTGGELSFYEAFGLAYRRFWSLLVAGAIVFGLILSGLFILVVPGIIFATWFLYSLPSIMLEGRGAIDGIRASKAFGQDKKLSTLLILLAVFVVAVIAAPLEPSFSAPLGLPAELGTLLTLLVEATITAWGSIIPTYVYLMYGPPSESRTGAWRSPDERRYE